VLLVRPGIECANQQITGCAKASNHLSHTYRLHSRSNRHENVGENQIRFDVGNFANSGFAIAHSNNINALILQASVTIF